MFSQRSYKPQQNGVSGFNEEPLVLSNKGIHACGLFHHNDITASRETQIWTSYFHHANRDKWLREIASRSAVSLHCAACLAYGGLLMSGNDRFPLLTHTIPGYNGPTKNLVFVFLLSSYMSLWDNTIIKHRTRSFQAEIVKGIVKNGKVVHLYCIS